MHLKQKPKQTKPKSLGLHRLFLIKKKKGLRKILCNKMQPKLDQLYQRTKT